MANDQNGVPGESTLPLALALSNAKMSLITDTTWEDVLIRALRGFEP
jgi:hypothetical protein